MLRGMKTVEARLNEILNFAQTDFAEMPASAKRKIAKTFLYIYESGAIAEGEHPVEKVKDCLEEIHKIVNSFILEVVDGNKAAINLPPTVKTLWPHTDGSFKITAKTLMGMAVKQPAKFVFQASGKPTKYFAPRNANEPDINLILNEIVDLLEMYPLTTIRRCQYPKCKKIFASVSIKEKFYHTTTCFYRHYGQIKRGLQKTKLLGEKLLKDYS